MHAPTLTQLLINPRHRDARHDLTDSNQLHKTLMRLAPDHLGPAPRASAGMLYRIEPDRHPTLLLQTAQPPDLAALPTHYATTARTRSLAPMLHALTPNLTVRYRITAAPTVCRSAGNPHPDPVTGKRRGKRTCLTGDDALAWWHDRARKAGLITLTCHSTPRPFPRHESTHKIPHYKLTQFEGLARITDTDLLTHAIRNGIGKAKTYGAGLLSLAPATQPHHR
ncbi:type I-E CRISPR-associated protein Cas6/Cse3/CasE [Streptomyces sp. NBC_00120]|uniref:type I-E CRISPR-associated protein Cas6/Cse3/CasE n=1 Tax=Streptomyces sp. NBC_00120 TaxID=2975660 RepID=UPI002255D78E|nr:type I-E CRISPR-associated protein Cas6/Cse3/CasE [Streptomyces sp. NBC_00120]MCX5321595.1 type I-E CRISPR-associated protein Cas6/Cse3/CasE [Streptomyces sp. NBC_00120]MCX5323869.1 type I-E CRISPR-associated protein Cas6/Cse3/CasE [Streptomyces sp. NBC_00120]MCX5327719.1 type I-E CRISPR-associated protein Cas6/Cse3/CasE [Streptomyces sp. NBC_00120]